MKRSLQTKIEEFLKHRRLSVNGCWARITEEDMTQLTAILELLISAKCQPDSDGDRPIEFALINRRTHNGLAYSVLPYHAWQCHDDADLPPPANDEEIMDLVMLNLSVASEDVTRLHRLARIVSHSYKGDVAAVEDDPKEEKP